MKTLFIFDCGCKIPIEKTDIKTYNKSGKRYTCHRLCKEHSGHLLHKIVTCDKCKAEIQVNSKCNRRKCKCGYTIHILNSDKPKKKIKKIKVKPVKECLYCENEANSNNDDCLCTFHHKEDQDDMYLLSQFDSFCRQSLELAESMVC